MEGVNFLWIFRPPGASPILAFFRTEITTGVRRNPMEKEVITAKIKNIIGWFKESKTNSNLIFRNYYTYFLKKNNLATYF
jgi:hypothetical protein